MNLGNYIIISEGEIICDKSYKEFLKERYNIICIYNNEDCNYTFIGEYNKLKKFINDELNFDYKIYNNQVNSYIITWNSEVYKNFETKILKDIMIIEYFNDENGFDEEDIENIKKLNYNEVLYIYDLNGIGLSIVKIK